MSSVLHLIDTTGPGGAETVFVELADRLRERGYESIPVIHGPGWVNDELCRRGLDPIIQPPGGSFDWRLVRCLVQQIRRHRVQVIQSHLLGSNVYAAIAGRLTGVPVVASFHGMVDVDSGDRLRKLRRAVMQLGVSRFVCVSQALCDALSSLGFVDGNRVEVIYNGIDVARYERARNDDLRVRLGVPIGTPLIGALGNLRPAKGYEVLLRAAADLKLRGVAFAIAIAGQGKGRLADELLARRRELGLEECVHFVGFQPDSAHYLAGLDLFVLSSLSEGFSISTIEAMAAGLPIVVTRCGGPEEIIEAERTGLMVPPGDPIALAYAIGCLLADQEVSSRLAECARQVARERFDIGQMVSAYSTIYTGLQKKTSGGS